LTLIRALAHKDVSMSDQPLVREDHAGERVHLAVAGNWTIASDRGLEDGAADIIKACTGKKAVTLDLSGVEAVDTAGAWVIDRARARLAAEGIDAVIAYKDPAQKLLFEEAKYRDFSTPQPPQGNMAVDVLADIGSSVSGAGRDLRSWVGFLGAVVETFFRALLQPSRLRFTSIIFHVETFAFRGLPIIALINFLVGCIVAQQGIFQLRQFGASAFAVDLIGILVLRELAVLLTAIMIAGRSGSAITAEIGSMKMREEIDAMRVMGLDPVEVLVLPRIIALIISLPLLTFLADMSALFGGMLVAWAYGDISPEVFMSRLKSAIAFNTFMVGLIKAPFMALVIGMIAAIEGFAVQGSAESLGRQVTSSVVKSIFMVIVVDGLFAMFFAAIKY
jgi:phospholipid/cholesterol/gamma-HCH transport system permease protein